jgi:transcriptional regulator with XRE-family HTH domain
MASDAMPRHRLNSYLRTYRLKAALSQSELGELLGLGGTAVCNYEIEFRSVSAKTLIASEVLFGVPAAELFPKLYRDVEKGIATRTRMLAERLEERDDPVAKKKFNFVSGICKRLSSLPGI